jgi:hypothetical protein
MGGGDFLKNPQGLNLLFCKPGTYLCSLFLFYFFAFGAGFSFGSRIFLFRSRGRLARVSNFGAGQKTKVNYKRFCPELKFETLAALFDFLGCLNVKVCRGSLSWQCFTIENGKHLKKTIQILPSALAVAKASVWFFDLFALTF